MPIDWSLLTRAPDIGAAASEGFAEGVQRGALGALTRDPHDANALARLAQFNPSMALEYENRAHKLDTYQREDAARSAAGAYAGARYPNALAPVAGALPAATMPTPAPNALSGLAPAQPTPNALGSARGGAGDAEWARWAALDPEAALKARGQETEWQSARLKLTKGELEAHRAINQAAYGLLWGVHDQASYEEARGAATHMFQQYGYDAPDLPDEYSPELVKGLQRSALDMREAITADLNDQKFQWRQDEDLRDDHRQERNTDDVISDRAARRGLVVRGQNVSAATARRGQDAASHDRQRGQNMTDRRDRDGWVQHPAGRGRTRGAPPATAPVATPTIRDASGRRMTLQGGKWVPVS